MSQRKACLGLASLVVLLLAVSAHAAEVSMDARGYSGEADQARQSIHRAADEPCATEIGSSQVESKARLRPKWASAKVITDQPLLTDAIDVGAGKPSESAGGSSSSNVALPPKPRNRWQSLVPGAIK